MVVEYVGLYRNVLECGGMYRNVVLKCGRKWWNAKTMSECFRMWSNDVSECGNVVKNCG